MAAARITELHKIKTSFGNNRLIFLCSYGTNAKDFNIKLIMIFLFMYICILP